MTRRRVMFLHCNAWTALPANYGWSDAMASAIAAHHDVEVLATPQVVLPPDWDGTDFVFASYAGDAWLARDIARAGARTRPYGVFVNGGVPAAWGDRPGGLEALRRAEIIACSEQAARELRALVSWTRVHLVPHGADDRCLRPSDALPVRDRRGFVAFGANNRRKRAVEIAGALAGLDLDVLTLDLDGTQQGARRIDDDARHAIVWHDPVFNRKDERDKFRRIGAARGVVCMSEHEGFFVPSAEAAALRTPFVSLRLPAIVETWCDAPLYVQDFDDLRATCDELARDDALVQRSGDRMHAMADRKGCTMARMGERIARVIDEACR